MSPLRDIRPEHDRTPSHGEWTLPICLVCADLETSLSHGMAFLHITSEMTAGEFLVGVGTLALATFTAWLARRTSAEVQVSEKQMRLSHESIEALDRPFIVPERRANRGILIGDGHLTAKLCNHGKGSALVEEVQLVSDAWTQYLQNPFENSVRAIAPAGELAIRIPLTQSPPPEGGELAFRVFYRSASGVRYVTISEARVVSDGLIDFTGHQRVDTASSRAFSHA